VWFAEDIVARLLGRSEVQRYRDFNGELYAIDADRGTDISKGEENVDIIWESENKFICKVQVELLDEKDFVTVAGYETHEFNYELVEGKWIFTNFYLFR
jgi:hypothetical protein